MEDPTQQFAVMLKGDLFSHATEKWTQGSTLRVRGICIMNPESSSASSFTILVPSASAVSVISGPPWWSGWRLARTICLLLLAGAAGLYMFFRLEKSKHQAILEEREHLAHEMHDTLAQSFAGVGYYLQSIRRSLRGLPQLPRDVLNNLEVDMQDLPQQFVTNVLYDLPFGRGRRFMNHGNSFADAVLGGWQLGAILRYESGTPVSFGCASAIPDWSECGRFSLTGNPIQSAASKNHTLNPLNVPGGLANPSINSLWNGATFGAQSSANQTAPAFYDQNNAHFRGTGPYTFGNSARVTAVDRMNPFFNEDFSILKTFTFYKETKFVLKVESFNTFNRHAWALPDENLNDPLFGVPTTTLTGPRLMQITGRILF